MPYFPVDDQAAFHPKFIAAGNAAIGLWTRAGSWSKAHATGGKIPSEIAQNLGKKAEINRLVFVELWTVTDGGYQFHDWTDQAGNFDADEEKARRENERERAKLRKRAQREREREAGHGKSHGVTPGGVTAPPSPSPSPIGQDTHLTPVLETAKSQQGSDEIESVESLCTRQASALGVDFAKVKREIGKACGRFPEPTGVMRIIATILDRATPPVRSPTGVVITAIRNDWAEWQQFLDEAS